jgi:hypothetical protein
MRIGEVQQPPHDDRRQRVGSAWTRITRAGPTPFSRGHFRYKARASKLMIAARVIRII